MSTSTIKKLELELNTIKNSNQYKLCNKLFLPIKILKKVFNNLYDIRVNKVKKLYKNSTFKTDKVFLKETDLKYEKVVILGNAKNLQELTKDKFSKYKNDEQTLIIGLNRSFYSFNTDILLWADYEIIDELNNNSTQNIENTIAVQTTNNNTKDNIQYWIDNKSLDSYPNNGLFKARNILVSALHLCYIYDIKEIELYGFEFDSRDYFFDTNEYEGIDEYEIKTDLLIQDEYLGYDTKKIAKEVLEYMISENFKIAYTGKSIFLSNIKRLVKNEY